MSETVQLWLSIFCWVLAIITFLLHVVGYMPTDDAIATMAILIVTMVGAKE